MKRDSANRRTSARHSAALIPAPEKIKAFMDLANSLPPSLRRSAGKGVHDLAMRWWESNNDQQTINLMFYLQRHVDELPLELQAFVLHDQDGLYIETPDGAAPLRDAYNVQPRENVALLRRSERELRKIISTAKERINLEIQIAEDRTSLRQERTPSGARKALKRLEELTNVRRDYKLGDDRFREVGISSLANRAKQRFLFALAAEEILYSLTSPDPEKELNRAWYLEKSGAVSHWLFVENDEVQLSPSVLLSFVVGVQVSRIRKCLVCENYFWAGRKDKRVCSNQCGATNRKRQERKRYFEIKVGDRKPRKRQRGR